MVFKLIRIDTPEPEKIELPVGTNLIGRGKLGVQCDDKRVSRKHGKLEVTEDSVSIKSLHQNPCFYKRRSTKKILVLKKDCTINLSHGDRFGLLPTIFWYELLDINITQDSSTGNVANDKNDGNSTKNQVDSTITNGSVEDMVKEDQNKSTTSNSKVSETVAENDAANRSESLLDVFNNEQSNQDKPGSSSLQNVEAKIIKRSNITSDIPSPVEVKKAKTEPEVTKEKLGPSKDQAGTSDDQKVIKISPLIVRRERCFYSGNCYRRKDEHYVKYSHPQDGDWGTEERVVCPKSQSCSRRDPRHWRDYTHPDGVVPPNTQAPKSGVTNSLQKKNSDSEEDNTDSEEDQTNSEEDHTDSEDHSDNEEDPTDDEEDHTDSEDHSDTEEDHDDSDGYPTNSEDNNDSEVKDTDTCH